MLYTYAIVLGRKALNDHLVGINDQPLELITTEHLGAIVSVGIDISALQSLPEPELISAVLTHDRIICALFCNYALLPLRFGTGFISAEALITYLTSHQEVLLTKLRSLQGKAEYQLQVTPQPFVAKPEALASGKAYLLAKKQRYQEQTNYELQLQIEQAEWLQSLQNWLHDRAIPFVIKESYPPKLYLLMTAQEVSHFQNVADPTVPLAQLCGDHWTWQISPPTPPYHFAE